MQISTYNVFEYTRDNPEHNIIFTDMNQRVVRLEADPEKECLYIEGIGPHEIYVYDDQVTINVERGGIAYKIVDDIPAPEYELIRMHALNKLAQIELKRLLPAVKDMLAHYENVAGPNQGIDLFVLRDLAYTQPSKGVVLLQVKFVTDQDKHTLRGYVAPFDKDAIYYEGVQAWRYAKVTETGSSTSEFSRALYAQLSDYIKEEISRR